MGKRIKMKKIREIIRQFNSNNDFSERKIARLINVSRPVVHQTINDFKKSGLTLTEIEKLSDDEFLDIIQNKKEESERYKNLSSEFDYITSELKRKGVTRQLLWVEYKNKYQDGFSYSQFNHHYQVWLSTTPLTMHMEHKAGDKLFVDFAGQKMAYYNPFTDEKTETEIFVSILSGSQLVYVEAVPSQKKEDFISANENAFLFYGGVSNALVPDCLKSAVTKADKYEPDLNPEYFDFARHYDTVILPARARHPKDKAYVELAVKLVYQGIYAPLRNNKYYSLAELNKAIFDQLEIFNNKKMQRIDLSRQEMFDRVEKNALKPLPQTTYEKKTFKYLKVQFNYHIYLSEDKNYYSVPYQYRGKQVEVIYSNKNVEIFYKNKRIASHKRDYTAAKYLTIKEHMPQQHQFMLDWTPQRFINWGNKIGENVADLVKAILEDKAHPEQGFKICLGILNLAKKYSDNRLDNACRRALAFRYYSYKGVKNILENNFDSKEEEENDLFSTTLPQHENTRGKDYYKKEILN